MTKSLREFMRTKLVMMILLTKAKNAILHS